MNPTAADFDQGYFESSYRDYVAQNPPRKVSAYVDVVRSYLPAGRLLEVGCAFGLYAAEMARFLDVTASDISSYAIDEARRLHPGTKVLWVTGQADQAPASESFDGIAAFDVLEHVPELEKETLPTLSRALRPGGFLFLTVPVYDGPLGLLVRWLDKDPTHIHKWSRADWQSLAFRQGFVLRDTVGLFRYGLGRRYLFFASRLIRKVSPAILLVLQKPYNTQQDGVP
jgi:SAM-dependent methyltransferase